jgi:hypothetical protein
MAEKFPPLDDAKHRAFGLDMARFGRGGMRAAVAVAERGRLSLHWSRADGTWGVFTRPHSNLAQSPRRPDQTHALGWSGRIGIAAAEDQVVLVYKRRFPNRDGSQTSAFGLTIDPFMVDAGTGDLRGPATPFSLPLGGLGLFRIGFSLWADLFNGRLLIVAQITRQGVGAVPMLALLETSWPKTDPALLESASEWTVTDLDAGGWNFDARREGQRLVVLHRREAPTHVLDVRFFDPAFGGGVVARLGDDTAEVPVAGLRQPSLTLVDVDLTSGTVTAVDDTLGFGENPRIHLLDPFIATIDRLERATIAVQPLAIRLHRMQSDAHLLMRTRRGWRTALLLNQPLKWAVTRRQFARVHQSIAIEPRPGGPGVRVTWAPLWSERPVVLFRREVTDKGTLLTFGHQDADLGALRATAFRVFDDDGGETLKAQAESFSVLDLGHRHVRGPQGDQQEPAEHRQIGPHEWTSEAPHADNAELTIVRKEDSGNTLAGMIAAATARPASGYAYTEMGDGGVRVVFESGLDLPPPTAAIDDKEFRAGWVAEPAMPGRAWVRLSDPGFIETDLPGVFAPPTVLNAVSLACLQQQALDGLALAADATHNSDPLAGDPLAFSMVGGGLVRYGAAELGASQIVAMTVTPESAGTVQGFATANSALAPPRPAVSASDQPFAAEIHRTRSLEFAGDAIEFQAVLPGSPDTVGFAFDWTFSDGGAATGADVFHTFTATRPDFSRPAPGQALDAHVVTLAVTAPNGDVSTVTMSLRLDRSLWATLWTAYSTFRKAPDDILDDGGDWSISDDEWKSYFTPGMFVRDVTVGFYRYTLRYVVDANGRGQRVDVTATPTHRGRFRFLGSASGQGDVEYDIPIEASLDEVVLTGQFGGGLGALIRIASVTATIRCRQRFTLGVQTSERRDDRDASELLTHQALLRPLTMVPSALAALPVGPTTHIVPSLTVDCGLTGAGWALGVLVPVLIASVGTAAVLVILLPLFLAVAPAIIGALTVSLIISVLIGASVGATATALLNWLVVQPFVISTIREQLEHPDTAASLRESGLVTFAGEGLSEAVARALIVQARTDGHAVAAPETLGRDRMRSPFVETIVVTEGACKALIRV